MSSGKNMMDMSGPLVVLGWIGVHMPAIVTVLGGILSIIWYGVRFYDRFVLNKRSIQE